MVGVLVVFGWVLVTKVGGLGERSEEARWGGCVIGRVHVLGVSDLHNVEFPRWKEEFIIVILGCADAFAMLLRMNCRILRL